MASFFYATPTEHPPYIPYPSHPWGPWERPVSVNLNWVTSNDAMVPYSDLNPNTVREWFYDLVKIGNNAMPLMKSSIDVMKKMIEIAYPGSQIILMIENYHELIVEDIEWDWDTKEKGEYSPERVRDDFYAEFLEKVKRLNHVAEESLIIEITAQNVDGLGDVNPKLDELYDEMITAEGRTEKWLEGKLTQKYLPKIEKYINYFKHLDDIFPWRVTQDKLNSGLLIPRNIYSEWKLYMKEFSSIHDTWMFYKRVLEPLEPFFSKPAALTHIPKPTATHSVGSFEKVATTKGGNKSRNSRKPRKSRKSRKLRKPRKPRKSRKSRKPRKSRR